MLELVTSLHLEKAAVQSYLTFIFKLPCSHLQNPQLPLLFLLLYFLWQ